MSLPNQAKNPKLSVEIKLRSLADKTSQKKALQASIQPEIEALDEDMNVLELDLLQLAEANRKDWFPKKKTAKFNHGDLAFRTSNRLVNISDLDTNLDPKPVDEHNTDLLKLARNKHTRKLVRITPVLSEFQKYISEHGAMPEGFEYVQVANHETFSARAYPLKEGTGFLYRLQTAWSLLWKR